MAHVPTHWGLHPAPKAACARLVTSTKALCSWTAQNFLELQRVVGAGESQGLCQGARGAGEGEREVKACASCGQPASALPCIRRFVSSQVG